MTESNLRIKMLEQYLADDPSDDFSEYALALEFEKAGDRKKSLFHFENLLQRSPDYLAAYYQYGKLCESEKKFYEASEVYEKGMQVAQQQGDSKTLNELRSALEMMD